MSHVARRDESCPPCEWVMSPMWMSRCTHSFLHDSEGAPYEWVMYESGPTCAWVMSHMWMSHDSYFLLHDWARAHLRHAVYDSFMCDMSRSQVWHDSCACSLLISGIRVYDSLICVTCLVHKCDMTHVHVFDMTRSCVGHDSPICIWHTSTYHGWALGSSQAYVCMTQSYVWHTSFLCVTRLMHTCDTPHSSVWHDSFISETWLMHMCNMTRLFVWGAMPVRGDIIQYTYTHMYT